MGRILGHFQVAGQGGAAEGPQVDIQHFVAPYAQPFGHPPGCIDLGLVSLPVAERQRVHVEAATLGDGRDGGRVHPAAQKDDGLGSAHAGKLA